jgi:hypothetical protein
VVVLSSLTKKGKKKKKKTKGLEIQGLVSVRIPGLQEFGASSLIQKASGRVLGMWRQEPPPMEESLHLWER